MTNRKNTRKPTILAAGLLLAILLLTSSVFGAEDAVLSDIYDAQSDVYGVSADAADSQTITMERRAMITDQIVLTKVSMLDLAFWYKGIDSAAYSRKIASATVSVPSTGQGYCALWVSKVYEAAGLGFINGNARDFWYYFGISNNTDDIREGMIIAVPHSPTSDQGWAYGHMGILVKNPYYTGDTVILGLDGSVEEVPGPLIDASGNEKWLVAHNTGVIEFTKLSKWVEDYNVTGEVRWGYAHY